VEARPRKEYEKAQAYIDGFNERQKPEYLKHQPELAGLDVKGDIKKIKELAENSKTKKNRRR
jgi:hypothetical protein